MPTVGQPAPDFALQNQDGKTVHLSDYRGKKVIIFAYPAAFTSGCETQACGFRDAMPRFGNVNAVIFGLSNDPTEKLKRWKDELKLPYDLLSDENHAVLEQWGAWGEKNNFGKISIGTIRSHWVIDETGNLIDERIKISPEDSVAAALETVNAS
jgi:peroxiredoxin Q/BCP